MIAVEKYRTANSPLAEGWQAQPDGVVSSLPKKFTIPKAAIPLLWRGGRRSLTGWHSPPVEGWQAKLDGVVV